MRRQNLLRLSVAAVTAVVALVPLTACQAAGGRVSQPATAVVRPVSTTLAVAPPGGDATTIADRFSTVIWPAVVDFHYDRAQNSHAQLQWLTIVDKGLDQGGWGALRQAVFDLGELAPDDTNKVSAGVEGLKLASARIDAASETDATLVACYTFTALTNAITSGLDPVRTPTAAEADFALVRTDNWYLHAIVNQHQVTGC